MPDAAEICRFEVGFEVCRQLPIRFIPALKENARLSPFVFDSISPASVESMVFTERADTPEVPRDAPEMARTCSIRMEIAYLGAVNLYAGKRQGGMIDDNITEDHKMFLKRACQFLGEDHAVA